MCTALLQRADALSLMSAGPLHVARDVVRALLLRLLDGG